MSTDQPAPYGGPDPGPAEHAESTPERTSEPLTPARVRTVHLQRLKDRGERFSMLTSYDAMTTGIFDEAGIEVLLVGDSAANVVLGQESTLRISLDEMLVFATAVVRAASRAMVVVDAPFGTYEASPQQAVECGVRLMKESGAHAVKVEADASMAEHVRAMVSAGIPVMAHVGFTPQSEHALGGYRIQGRGETGSQVLRDALALEAAGAFAVLLEMVPEEVAAEVDAQLGVPTIGIGAGAATTGQVLVWQDMLGLTAGRVPKFVRQYADLRATMSEAVREYRDEVRSGAFPTADHSY